MWILNSGLPHESLPLRHLGHLCCLALQIFKTFVQIFLILAEGFLKLPSLHMLVKQKNPSLSRNLVLGTLGELLIVFSIKVNLLYLFYSRCGLLHLIQKNRFLKTFLRIPILMIQYLFTCLSFSRSNLKLHNIYLTMI